jgi:hypothetical protein
MTKVYVLTGKSAAAGTVQPAQKARMNTGVMPGLQPVVRARSTRFWPTACTPVMLELILVNRNSFNSSFEAILMAGRGGLLLSRESAA